jgi:hypothetical protein
MGESTLLNAGMNRLVNCLPYGDFKMKFIPLLSNAIVKNLFGFDNYAKTSILLCFYWVNFLP